MLNKKKVRKVFIIAEAGVNHNGKLKNALKLIDIASESGVDAIKFQTWKTDLLMIKSTKTAAYQKKNTNFRSQYNMAKKLELKFDEFSILKKYCDKKNIIFLSTADDFSSASFLKNLQNIFKIGSGEINNLPFLQYIGSFKKKIILSSGISTMGEIKKAIRILMTAGTSKKNITVLHCNSEYPTPYQDVNLKAMLNIKEKLNVDVGYSDHTIGPEASIAAVSLGASIIEKHFTFNVNQKGPDHQSSMSAIDLKKLIKSIRIVEKCLGSKIKKPSKSELKNIYVIRKSIVAKKSIIKGDIFTKYNITVKRPGIGLSPMKWNKIIGKKAKKNYKKDDFIK